MYELSTRPNRSHVTTPQGFDEEISGRRGAQFISQTLLARYGANGIAFIVDEGITGVGHLFNQTFAWLGMAEKGAVSVKLEVLAAGGHSSVPPKHTGIGIMSRLLVALEDQPFPVELAPGSPALGFLACAAQYGTLEPRIKAAVEDSSKWHVLSQQAAAMGDVQRAFLGTSQALDLVQGGVKVGTRNERKLCSPSLTRVSR